LGIERPAALAQWPGASGVHVGGQPQLWTLSGRQGFLQAVGL